MNQSTLEDYIAYTLIGIVLILFFYYGYKDDFKRSPKEFIKIIIGVPIGFIASIFGIIGITACIKKWITNNNEE